ncbi:VanZ family protein [Anaeromicrobium sediminis]|uniref:VanZ-like domain-containing protein n=1 Tax=Anaeromicrobium sediminis TaxID=1478221 RepID=A0A267MIW0_9FIRM|nr:VanZ family protein [Anaeromicrobium sediminis]PAB59524.1 hypothetical protein CCE28_09935 [Anaeromicrobium sediminis]
MKKKHINVMSKLLLGVYLIYLFYLVFLSPYYGRTTYHVSYNVIPFSTISEYAFLKYGIRNTIINIGGNIVAFMPLGFLLPLAYNKTNNYIKIFMLALITTCSIELLQYIYRVGTCDIDDIILNLVGAMLGYILVKKIKI